jgi:hypothetical protein
MLVLITESLLKWANVRGTNALLRSSTETCQFGKGQLVYNLNHATDIKFTWR